MKGETEEEEEKFHQASSPLISHIVVVPLIGKGMRDSCVWRDNERKLWHDVGNYENKAEREKI